VSQTNIWTIPASILANEKPPAYLRFVFSTTATEVQVTRRYRVPVTGGGHGPVRDLAAEPAADIIVDPFTQTITLAQWITESGLRFVGWDGDSSVIAYARIATAAAEGSVDG